MIKLNTFDRISLTQFCQEYHIPKMNDIILGDYVDPIHLHQFKKLREKDEIFFEILNSPIENIHPHINCMFQTIPIDFNYREMFGEMISKVFYPIHTEMELLDYQFEYIIRFHLIKFYQLIKTHHILMKYPVINENIIVLDITGWEYDINEFKDGINKLLMNLFETHFQCNAEMDKAIVLHEKLSELKVLIYWTGNKQILMGNSEQLVKEAQDIVTSEILKTKLQIRTPNGKSSTPKKGYQRHGRTNSSTHLNGSMKSDVGGVSETNETSGTSSTDGSEISNRVNIVPMGDPNGMETPIEIHNQKIIFVNRNTAESIYSKRINIEKKYKVKLGFFDIDLSCIFDSIVERKKGELLKKSAYKHHSRKLSGSNKKVSVLDVSNDSVFCQSPIKNIVNTIYYHFNIEYKPQTFAGRIINRKEIVIYHQKTMWNSMRIEEIYYNKGGLDGNEIDLKETLMSFDEGIRVIEYNTKTIDWNQILETIYTCCSSNMNIGRITICVHNENDVNTLIPCLNNYQFYWYKVYNNEIQGSTIDRSQSLIDITNTPRKRMLHESKINKKLTSIPEECIFTNTSSIHMGDEIVLLNQFVKENIEELTIGNGYVHQYNEIPIVITGSDEHVIECLEAIEIMNYSKLSNNYTELISKSAYTLFPQYHKWIETIIKSFHISYRDIVGHVYYSKHNIHALNSLIDISLDFINAFEFMKERRSSGMTSIQKIIYEYNRLSYEERRFCLYKASKPQYKLCNCIIVRGTNIVLDQETISGYDSENVCNDDGSIENDTKKSIHGIVFRIVDENNDDELYDSENVVLVMTPSNNIIWRGTGSFTTVTSSRSFLLKYLTTL